MDERVDNVICRTPVASSPPAGLGAPVLRSSRAFYNSVKSRGTVMRLKTGLGAAAAVGLLFSTVHAAELGSTGLDPTSMDRSVRPGDDFFDYMNGAWLKTVAIPPDRSSWGDVARLRERSLTRVRGILESVADRPSDPDARKFGDLYASYMDAAKIESYGRCSRRAARTRRHRRDPHSRRSGANHGDTGSDAAAVRLRRASIELSAQTGRHGRPEDPDPVRRRRRAGRPRSARSRVLPQQRSQDDGGGAAPTGSIWRGCSPWPGMTTSRPAWRAFSTWRPRSRERTGPESSRAISTKSTIRCRRRP